MTPGAVACRSEEYAYSAPRIVTTVPRLHLVLLVAAACRPETPAAPPSSSPPVVAAEAPARAPEPAPATAPAAEPAPAPEPPPTWEWAIAQLPALAGHSEVDLGVAAQARFLAWFAGDPKPRVYALLEGKCHAIDGAVDDDGFHGGWRRQVSVVGDERTVSMMSFDVSRHGISESGPGGEIFARDRRGRWQPVGGFGTGSGASLVDRPMSAADDRSVTFAGTRYSLEPACKTHEKVTQTCTDGRRRECQRCAGVTLQMHTFEARHYAGTVQVRWTEPTPVDCTQACPADEWTPRLPGLAAALKGRYFFAADAGAGPTIFRAAKDCARELRRQRARPAKPEPAE